MTNFPELVLLPSPHTRYPSRATVDLDSAETDDSNSGLLFQGARDMFKSLPSGKVELQEPLYCVVWDAPGVHNRVEVPRGFVSDGASIPRLLWPILGPPIGDLHLIPAIVHDWLCVQARTYTQRVLADAVFFALLKDYQVPYWKRALLYLGVRWYGRLVWRPAGDKA